MSRATRLVGLLQSLRRRRLPVSAAVLAAEHDVSVRTIYRDVATLVGQGATIVGDAGLGYRLEAGFLLPPMMFTAEEIEALVLGLRLAARQGDPALATGADHAAAKINAVLPQDLRQLVEDCALLAGPSPTVPWLVEARRALRSERKVRLRYRDAGDRVTERTVWPVALAFFEGSRVLAAWCELRGGFRSFRADRIEHMTVLDARPPRRRATMMREWRATVGAPAPD